MKLAIMIRSVLLLILSEACVESFLSGDFEVSCVKAGVSKVLGLGIVTGSCLVKVPQIVKLFRSESAEGISFLGVLLELCAITATMAYSYINSYPFSSYGDSVFLSLQTSIIGFMVLLYGKKTTGAFSFAVLYTVVVFTLISGVTPLNILWYMQAMVIPLVVSGKMIQAYANYSNQSTGQLSAVTVFLLFLGSMARIFTSIQETGDSLIIFTYLVATTVNGILAFQVIWYWNSAKDKQKRV